MEVGDYVRTRDGLIGKIQKNDDGIWISLVKDEDPFLYIHKEDIIKNCKDIISLVEVGDYVNGGKVYEKEKEYIVINSDFGKLFVFMNVYKKNIKSIVTKEQFESMKYKVGD